MNTEEILKQENAIVYPEINLEVEGNLDELCNTRREFSEPELILNFMEKKNHLKKTDIIKYLQEVCTKRELALLCTGLFFSSISMAKHSDPMSLLLGLLSELGEESKG